MDNLTLYPQLIDYIYEYCDEFQTHNERLAVRTFRHDGPDINGDFRAMCVTKGWISDEPEVKKLMAPGFELFKEQVATRIFNQHKDELDLNICPKCFKITRTPWAKQCRFCRHDWH
jgi:hypothetical protein